MTCPTISMTWPQYLRNQCVIDGNLKKLEPRYSKLLLLLLLRRGVLTSYGHAIEWMWYDSDNEPDYAKTIVSMGLSALRKLGIPIKTYPAIGFQILD